MPEQPDGFLVLDKPAGPSSRQALDHVTRLFPRVKIGHSGTLDPMASGVLVVCVGKATRLVSCVQKMSKEYRAELRLGQRSSTHDLESPVESVSFPGDISAERFREVVGQFRGTIRQLPPQHSAVHVGGRRAYELARRGEATVLAPREVRIDQLLCVSFDYPRAVLQIQCGSGTYVRSLARDIGEALGCGAVLASLVRTRVGPYSIDRAIPLENCDRATVTRSLLPLHSAVGQLATLTAPNRVHLDIAHGRTVACSLLCDSQLEPGQECALCDPAGELLAIATVDANRQTLHPRIVLVSPDSLETRPGAVRE